MTNTHNDDGLSYMPRYQYYLCDVFTVKRFGGNQLAVLPDADGLTAGQMQQVAREFNFSETAFVFPSKAGHTRLIRIFTPTMEIPFAGHPTLGAAFVLVTTGALGDFDCLTTITFEERAGPVSITIDPRDGLWCELAAPQRISLGSEVSTKRLAQTIGLDDSDILTNTHCPQVASVGLPFLFAELKDREALERARVNTLRLEELAAMNIQPDIHLYIHSRDDFDIRARMFAPLDGVPEDPATGSANCALAGLLSFYSQESDFSAAYRIAQGVEMGRPSVINARAEKREGEVVETFVGGSCAMVAEGVIVIE